MCLKIPTRANLFYGKGRNWDQITPSKSPRARGATSKFGKERVHREELLKCVNLMSAIRALPDFWKEHKTKPCNEKDAPAEWHGTCRQMSTSSKNTDKASFYSPIEARATPAAPSKTPQEREFVVDFGASMLSKRI